MKKHLILAINPGSTSTKVAIFENEKQLAVSNIKHNDSDLAHFETIFDQLDYRAGVVKKFLEDNNYKISDLSAIVGRGGPIRPLPSGTYMVDEELENHLRNKYAVIHVSLIGGLIAKKLAGEAVKNVFIVDPVCVDELCDEARVSGHPMIERQSLSHALNIKAIGKRAAVDLNAEYDKLNLVIAHLGSGTSVTAHKGGRMIDVNNASDEGPFSIDRTGGMPLRAVINVCYCGKYSKSETEAMFLKKGGMLAYFGINDGKAIEDMAHNGDKKALLVYKGLCHQVCKEIGAMATVLEGKVDAIVITGGMAYSKWFIDMVKQKVSYISKVMVYPGEDEASALAAGALRVLTGSENAKKIAEQPLPEKII